MNCCVVLYQEQTEWRKPFCVRKIVNSSKGGTENVDEYKLMRTSERKWDGISHGWGVLQIDERHKQWSTYGGEKSQCHKREKEIECKRVLTMVYSTQNYWVSGLYPSSRTLNTRAQRFGNWISNHLQVRREGGGDTSQLGPLQNANLQVKWQDGG
jgi:hypothetical protein